MRVASLVVWVLLIFGITKLTFYGYAQVMIQVAEIQDTYISIGDQFDDNDIQQTNQAIGSLGR